MRVISTLGVVAVAVGSVVVGPAAPAAAAHEHLVRITNPHTGAVTCQYVARGATPTNDAFHEHAHTGPGQAHRSDVAYLDKESNVQGGTCDVVRGRQTAVVEPH